MSPAGRGATGTLARRVQRALSRYYAIEEAPDVDDFVRAADGEAREVLVVRELDGALELAVELPRAAIDGGPLTADAVCQTVEGVSHFLYIAERARRELPATQLELEIQAEVDKYVFFAIAPAEGQRRSGFEPERAAALRSRLFERVTYCDPEGSERGDRYRLANGIAARFAGRLEARLARFGRFAELRATLRHFYAAGQTQKIELARAA